MNKTWLTTGGLVMAVVILLAVNILSNTFLTTSRLDLTDNGLYTLSKGTKNILSELDEPITVRLFISQKELTRLPALGSYATRVRNLLEEYQRGSNGKLTLKVIDPEPFSEEEDRAVGYGIQGLPFEDGSEVVYFGAVGTNSTDQQEVIPFFAADRQEFLEYDLSKMITTLSVTDKQVVGLLSVLPVTGTAGFMPGSQPQPAWTVIEQLRQLFDVQELDLEVETIPDEVSVLVVIHPQNFSDSLIYAIDQYVLAGGHLLMFVDPNAEAQPPMPGQGVIPDTGSHLNKLTSGWGVELVEGKVVGDLSRAVRVRTSPQHGSVVVDYPIWMEFSQQELSDDDIVTSQLGNITIGSPGYLKIDSSAGTTVTPLLSTTDNAMIFDKSEVGLTNDPQQLLRNYKPGGEALVLAARIQGAVKTAFPDGKPAVAAKEEKEGDADKAPEQANAEETASDTHTHLADSQSDTNVLLVADTDLLQDRFWVIVQNMLGSRVAVPNAGNGTMVVNAVDNLAGSNDLISVRNRGEYTRPFTKVQAIRKDAEERYRQKEQELTDRLEQTEIKLQELQQMANAGGDAAIVSAEQSKEIQTFRDQRVKVRKDLREVRRSLRSEIQQVENVARFANVGLMPLLIGVGGLIVGFWRMRRRRRQAATN